MKHISILAIQEATVSSIDSAYQLFNRVNDFLHYQGKPADYTIEVIGLHQQILLNKNLYAIRVNTTIDAVKDTDVIIVPMLCGGFSQAIQNNSAYFNWIREQHKKGAEIVCLCVGSFLLAATGVLDGKKAAVHWAAKNEFMQLFPDVHVQKNAVIVNDSNIYTCGGGFAYLNLLLYVIERHHGKAMSILAAKMFEIDPQRDSQQPFMIFMAPKQHGDADVLAAQQLIEKDPTQSFSIDSICTALHVTRRTFERKFRKYTGDSVAVYIQKVKVEYVKQQLETSQKNINEIIYGVGYNDADAFRRVFKKYTDLAMSDYRKKYSS